MSLYEYAQSRPTTSSDPTGMVILPCPLEKPTDSNDWCKDDLAKGHCGMDCYRQVVRSFSNGRSGNQCCYFAGENGTLFIPGRYCWKDMDCTQAVRCGGTVDRWAPANGRRRNGKCTYDIFRTIFHIGTDVTHLFASDEDETQCCMREPPHNIPSGTPGESGKTDQDVERAWHDCRRRVNDGQRFCHCICPQ